MVTRVSPRQFAWALIALVSLPGVGAGYLAAAPPKSAAGPVALLFRAQSSQREAAFALQQSLESTGHRCTAIELPVDRDDVAEQQAIRRLVDMKPEIVATGGTRATLLALEHLPRTPVFFFMVPNTLDAPFLAPDNPDRHRVTGVTTDIAPESQIEWLASVCPGVKTVGILTSPRSERTVSAIRSAAREYAISVVPIQAKKDEFIPAIEALNSHGCDAVLMIPDAQVYNSLSVQRLLLWGIRQRKPVITFSAHVVKAGALTGLYCENDSVGRQSAHLIQRIIRGTDIPSVGLRYPDHVSRAVNERTAAMIGTPIEERKITPDTLRFGNGE